MYKESKYNYYVKSKDGYLLYNTLYNGLVKLNEEEYKQVKNIEKLKFNKELTKELYDNGFLVPKTIDEDTIYEKLRLIVEKIDKNRLDLTIAVTTNCNARCIYCYEEGIKPYNMNFECADKIIKFILEYKDIEKININWFGGEPLLNVSVIDYITEKLKKNHIQFSSTITTNGYYIDKIDISTLKEKWNVRNIQITLDGTKEEYEKRKRYKNKEQDIFEKIINNIEKLINNKIYVSVRLNIDKKNKDNILDLVKYLKHRFLLNSYLNIYIAFLNYSLLSEALFSTKEKEEIVLKIYKELPVCSILEYENLLENIPQVYGCLYDDPQAYVIDSEGYIYKCEHYIGIHNKSIGNIYEDNINQKIYRVKGKRKCDIKCKKCIFYPKCLEGCYAYFCENTDHCGVEKYIIKTHLKTL